MHSRYDIGSVYYQTIYFNQGQVIIFTKLWIEFYNSFNLFVVIIHIFPLRPAFDHGRLGHLQSLEYYVLIIICVSQEIFVNHPALFVIPAGSEKLKDTLPDGSYGVRMNLFEKHLHPSNSHDSSGTLGPHRSHQDSLSP